MEDDEAHDYMFVADCHGLTSLTDEWTNEAFSMSNMYCMSNEHRRCVWGMITLHKHIADELIEMMNRGEGDLCLNLIKTSKYAFSKNNVTKYSRWMEQIPNPILDPFHTAPEPEEVR